MAGTKAGDGRLKEVERRYKECVVMALACTGTGGIFEWIKNVEGSEAEAGLEWHTSWKNRTGETDA
jgi:hypothetical protein